MLSLIFILWHHENHIRHMTHESNVKHTLMCFSICTDKTCTVNSNEHIEILTANIMQHLVIGSLKER